MYGQLGQFRLGHGVWGVFPLRGCQHNAGDFQQGSFHQDDVVTDHLPQVLDQIEPSHPV